MRRTHGMRSSRLFHTSATWPPGLSTRAISGSAASWSNQWKACATTTTSTERSLAGISSAVATLALTSGTRWRSTSSIASSGSVAKTAWPWSTSSRVSLPVPAPSSRTTFASPPASQATASAG